MTRIRWNLPYYLDLYQDIHSSLTSLGSRIDAIVNGRIAPTVDDLSIGSARKMTAAVLVFDLRGFSERTGGDDDRHLKEGLLTLNAALPTVMKIVYDAGGYIEKNTGDGVLAVVGAEEPATTAVDSALDASLAIKAAIQYALNPYLVTLGVRPIHWRIGIDFGPLLLARIGRPSGSAKHPRSFLTAVGAAANRATRIQQRAGTDEIWVGDAARYYADLVRQRWFTDVTPRDWNWRYTITGAVSPVWRLDEVWSDPLAPLLPSLLPR